MKPMKAVAVTDLSVVRYPVLVTPKIDGIRCILKDGVAYSATMKRIPNQYIQDKLATIKTPYVLDGELTCGNFQETSSAVMSDFKECDFTYHVFDVVNDLAAEWRRTELSCVFQNINVINFLTFWLGMEVQNEHDLIDWVNHYEERGFEGTMLRSPTALYKHGRSTLKEQALLKIKKFSDAEAVIVGIEEEFQNNNEQTTNELGLSTRSTAKANLVGKRTLGAFVCRTSEGIEFKIGSGFTAAQRKQFFTEELIGKLVKYKFFDYGIKEKPPTPCVFRVSQSYRYDGVLK